MPHVPHPAPGTAAARRRLLVAGNWKMNGNRALARSLALAAKAAADAAPGVDVAVFPPFPLLGVVAEALALPDGRAAMGGQTCHAEESGAHTGSVSAAMLVETGCTRVLVGHSEVRREWSQDDEGVRGLTRAAIAAGLRPIVCVGETRAERDAGRAREVVERQLRAVVHEIGHGAGNLDVAYEPVWAIGTGLQATPVEVREAHGWIRATLDAAGGERARILYGGSVNRANIGGFLSEPVVDGVLVGGQSLDPAAFTSLVEAARVESERSSADTSPAAGNPALRRRP